MLDKETVEKLNQYPELCERVKQMLSIVENAAGETTLADVAEQWIIDEMRGLGHDLLQSWATEQADKTAMRAKAHKPGLRTLKKVMWYSTYGTIAITEQTFYQAKGGRFRPFLIGCGIEHRRCSIPLQRVLVDFGAEYTFNQVHHHVKEHYGIRLPDSLPRRMTLKHAQG